MLDALEKTLWASANTLRANTDAARNEHLVLGAARAVRAGGSDGRPAR